MKEVQGKLMKIQMMFESISRNIYNKNDYDKELYEGMVGRYVTHSCSHVIKCEYTDLDVTSQDGLGHFILLRLSVLHNTVFHHRSEEESRLRSRRFFRYLKQNEQ